MFRNEITKITDRIMNEFKTYEERTSFVFIGYFRLYCLINLNTKLDNLKNSLEVLDYLFGLWSLNDLDTKSIEENFDILGLKTLKNISKNPNTEKFCKEILELEEFSIDDLIDMFELLSPSDKSLNDFFTPKSISNFIGKITINGCNFSNKEEIKICDPTCGVGRLLISTYRDLKEKYPDKKIICLGNDIFPKYSVFTKSILDLINFGNNHITIGNGLYFKPKCDLIIGNPPFGTLSKHKTEEYIRVQHYIQKTPFENKYKHLKSLNEKEFNEIVNDFKVV